MGFSVSGGTVVLLIAFIAAGAIISGTVFSVQESRDTAVTAYHEHVQDRNDAKMTFGEVEFNESTETLTIDVNNTGAVSLETTKISVVIDGEYELDYDTRVDGIGDRTVWAPGTTLTIEINDVSEPDRIYIHTDSGIPIFTDDVTTVGDENGG